MGASSGCRLNDDCGGIRQFPVDLNRTTGQPQPAPEPAVKSNLFNGYWLTFTSICTGNNPSYYDDIEILKRAIIYELSVRYSKCSFSLKDNENNPINSYAKKYHMPILDKMARCACSLYNN